MPTISSAPNGQKTTLTGNERLVIDDIVDNPGAPDKYIQLNDLGQVITGGFAYKLDATVDPGVNNDINDSVNASDGVGFVRGSLWFNATTNTFWICENNADGAAEWQVFSGSFQDQTLNHTLGGSTNINFGQGRFVTINMQSNINELGLTNVAKGLVYFVKIVQDGIGGWTINDIQGVEYTADGSPITSKILTGANEVTFLKIWVAETGLFKIIEVFYNTPQSGGGGGGHTIQNETTPLTQRDNLNFQGFDIVDDAGNNATVITSQALLEGAVNKDLATNYVFGAKGKYKYGAINYYANATDGLHSATFSVRTDANTTWEAISSSNLQDFIEGVYTTPGEGYSVGTSTNWEVRFEPSFGASAPSKDFKVTFLIYDIP